jgi:hypothetical protein
MIAILFPARCFGDNFFSNLKEENIMKKLTLCGLLVLGLATTMATAQTPKAEKKEARSDVKEAKSEKKEAKGKYGRAARKDSRSAVKAAKSDKKEVKGK